MHKKEQTKRKPLPFPQINIKSQYNNIEDYKEYLTSPEKDKVLFAFYSKTQPGGPGWEKILTRADKAKISIIKITEKWSVPNGILAMILGCILIYSTMFAIGNYIYGNYFSAIILSVIVIVFSFLLIKVWKKIRGSVL